MKGDFTRHTFAGRNHYRAVLAQQGRVQLDADWNEQAELQAHLDRLTGRDVVGEHGTPIDLLTGSSGMEIVDGAGQPPKGTPTSDLWISPGRYYVGGVLCENEEKVRVAQQPDLPGDPAQHPDLLADPEAHGPGRYVAYLDVWQELLTALERPELLEVALGGVTTTTRARTVWQVRFRPDAAGPAAARSTTRMSARAEAPAADEDPDCPLPSSARYRRLENQLYRIEILDGDHDAAGNPISPTFVWSRENGSVAARLLKPYGDVLALDRTGLDERLTFATDPLPWVEVTDLGRARRGEPGFLGLVGKAEGTQLTISQWRAGQQPGKLGDGAVVRRWDSPGAVPAAAGEWIKLEDGVEVQFEAGGTFVTGDYWLVPARTADLDGQPAIPGLAGNVDWPVDPTTGTPIPAPAQGIEHRYADLAAFTFDGKAWTRDQDLRHVFRSLTELDASAIRFDAGGCWSLTGTATVDQALKQLAAVPVLHVISGQAQAGPPGTALRDGIQVEVTDGCGGRMAGVTIQFAASDGVLAADRGALMGAGRSLDVVTDAMGRAGCVWQLGSRSVLQTVSAELIGHPGQPPAVPVTVVAGVQPPSPFAPGLHVTGAELASAPGSALQSEQQVEAGELTGGIQVLLDAAPAPATVARPGVLTVTLGLPFPFSAADQALWGTGIVGYTPLELAGRAELVDVTGTPAIRWTPAAATQTMLGGLFTLMRANTRGDVLPCRVVLSGRSVAAADGRLLNGLAPTGILASGKPGLVLPSTDEVHGADFELRLSLVEVRAVLVVIPLGTPMTFKSSTDAIALTMDRAALGDLLPAGITVEQGPDPDLVAARRAVGRAFRGRPRTDRQLSIVVDSRYADAANQLAQDATAAGLTVTLAPAADPAAEVAARLAAGQPVDGVITDSGRAEGLRALPGAAAPVTL
jgi:hypothetical protein